MMNSQEYETALREGTPIVTLIFSDASYGLINGSRWITSDTTALWISRIPIL